MGGNFANYYSIVKSFCRYIFIEYKIFFTVLIIVIF